MVAMRSHVLLLNFSYEPLRICSWKRAVILILKGKATAIEHQDYTLPAGFSLPSVIRLTHYVRLPHKNIPLSRKNLLHRDQYHCQYCHRKGDLSIDHVIPRSRGGGDDWENVVIACVRCNIFKGNRTPQEAGMTLKKKPVKPHYFIYFELSKLRLLNHTMYEHWKKYLFDQDEKIFI